MPPTLESGQGRALAFGKPVFCATNQHRHFLKLAVGTVLYKSLGRGLTFGKPVFCLTSPPSRYEGLMSGAALHRGPDGGLVFKKPLVCPTALPDGLGSLAMGIYGSPQPMVFHTDMASGMGCASHLAFEQPKRGNLTGLRVSWGSVDPK
jgi:hypothetical protein